MALYSFVILISLIFVSVDATNNWTKPCFYGECEYSLPSHVPASGSLKIVRNSIIYRYVYLNHRCSGALPMHSQTSHRQPVGKSLIALQMGSNRKSVSCARITAPTPPIVTIFIKMMAP